MSKLRVLAVLFLAAAGAVVLFARQALASEKYVCTVSSTNPTAASTASPSAGTCSWGAGEPIAIQCAAAVHYDSSGTASTDDVKIDFATNPDPYKVKLGQGETNVSILAASGTVACRFFRIQE
jgi:hypothetical protein